MALSRTNLENPGFREQRQCWAENMRMCDRILSLHSACHTDEGSMSYTSYGGFLSPAMAKEETFFQKPWHCEFPVECITFVPTLPGRVQVYTTCLEVMNSCRTTGSPIWRLWDQVRVENSFLVELNHWTGSSDFISTPLKWVVSPSPCSGVLYNLENSKLPSLKLT